MSMYRKKWIIVLYLLIAMMIIVACGTKEKSRENSATEIAVSDPGEGIFKQSCASCHGEDLTGGAGPSLENIATKYSEEAIKDIINNGTGTMFPVNLPDNEIEKLVEWLFNK